MGYWKVVVEKAGLKSDPHNQYWVHFAKKGRGYNTALITDADGARQVVKKLTEALKSNGDWIEGDD